MRKHLFHLLLAALLPAFAASSVVSAQTTTVKGQVIDADLSDPLVGASVTVAGTGTGVSTDLEGAFSLRVARNATISIKYLGYKEYTRRITESGTVDLGVIRLAPDAYTLGDVVITSSIAIDRKTPVAVSTLSPVFIEEKLSTQEFPELLKSTPSVYATKQGGGYGDSRVDIRGFKSENIAMMINGIPMNDMEWGGVYWSNWAGMSDVTRSFQVQRGIGASKVSAPSIGGSINIVTKTIDAQKGGSISYAMGNDGYNKLYFTTSTGLTKSGWAITLLGAKTWGDGYIQGTDFEAYSYFVNISKRINDNHQLSFTAFGSPQWHNQRNNNDGLTIEGWQKVKNYMGDDSPYKYNPTYGFGKNGERKYSARNEYHKPQLSLNHLWQISDKSSLSSSFYVSIGRGSGYSGQGLTSADRSKWYGATNGVLNTEFRNTDGTFAYDKIYDLNQTSEQGSVMAMAKSVNSHNWYGLMSTFNSKLGEHFDYYVGLDLRYYKGIHTTELVDLYGGDYYVDSSSRNSVLPQFNSAARAGSAFVNQKMKVGDTVYRDYDGYVMQEGVFAQGEYNLDKLNVFVAGSLSNTGYWRYDRFYYDEDHAKSKTVNFLGFTAKGGVNYNLTENHNIFANVGFISRAPFYSGGAFLQSTTSNATNPDAVNEKSFSAEVGYGYRSRYLSANVNVYHTQWMDKTMSRGINFNNADGQLVDVLSMNMSGLDATHQGVELDFRAVPLHWLEVTGMFSIGNWRWTSNATGYFYDSTSQPVKSYDSKTGVITHASAVGADDHAKMTVNLKDVKVSGSAQTTAAVGATAQVLKDVRVGVDWTFFGRNYSSWAFPTTGELVLNGTKNYMSPWRMPSASVVDIQANYRFKIGTLNATLFGNVNNLLDQEYITDANDGANHDWKTAYGVFYAFGRTYSVRLRINF